MKKLFVFLSLVMVCTVQAAHSDEYENELQRAFARRREAQSEVDPDRTQAETTPAPRVPAPPRRSVAVPSNVAAVFGSHGAPAATTPAHRLPAPPRRSVAVPSNGAPAVTTARRVPAPPRRVPAAPGSQAASFNFDSLPTPHISLLDGSSVAEVTARPAARRVAPPVAPKPQNCVVCLDSVGRDDKIMLGCNHAFHKDCIKTWVTGHDVYGGSQEHCPNCRQPITNEDKQKLGIAVSERGSGAVGNGRVPVIGSDRVMYGWGTGDAVQVIGSHGQVRRPDTGMAGILNEVNRFAAQLPGNRRTIYSSRGNPIGTLSNRLYDVLNRDELNHIVYNLETRAAARRRVLLPEHNLDSLVEDLRLTWNRPRAVAQVVEERAAIREGRPMWTTPVTIGGIRGFITQGGELNLDSTNLADISGLQDLSAADKTKVIKLSLRNNNIKDLPIGSLDGFPNLREIDFTNNPLDGDVHPYVMSLGGIRKLQTLRGLNLQELLNTRQLLNVPRHQVPEYLRSIYDRPFASEILDKLIQLTMDN